MKEIDDIRVGDAMTKGVICVDVKDTVHYAAEVMEKNEISSVIVTENGEGIGMITERDILTKLVVKSKDAKKMTCKEVMTSPLITIEPGVSIDDAAVAMRNNNIHRLVVADSDKITGVLSEFDIVRIEPALHLLIREQSKWNITEKTSPGSGSISGGCEACENYSEDLQSIDGRLLCDDCR